MQVCNLYCIQSEAFHGNIQRKRRYCRIVYHTDCYLQYIIRYYNNIQYSKQCCSYTPYRKDLRRLVYQQYGNNRLDQLYKWFEYDPVCCIFEYRISVDS